MNKEKLEELKERLLDKYEFDYFPLKGKIPVTKNGVLDSSRVAKISSSQNVGLRTGKYEDKKYLTIIDCDSKEGLKSWINMTNEKNIPDTLIVKTGKQGYHFYYWTTTETKNTVSKIGNKIDVRGKGGYVVAPFSIHPETKAKYEFYNENKISFIPESAMEIFKKEKETDKINILKSMETIKKGNRNDSLTRYIGKMKGKGLDETELLTLAQQYNDTKLEPSLVDSEVIRIFNSIMKYEKADLNYGKIILPFYEHQKYYDNRYKICVLGGKVLALDGGNLTGEKLTKQFFEQKYERRVFEKKDFNKKGDEQIKILPTAKTWFENTKVYDGVDFRPEKNEIIKEGERELINTWEGFKYQPENTGKAKPFIDFMKETICNGDDKLFNWLWKYLSHIIQHPEKPEAKCVILQSIQGTGKSWFVNQIGEILGNSYIADEKGKKILQKFNSLLAGKILVNIDEMANADWANNKVSSIRDQLKSLINNLKTIPIEYKGKDAISVNNYARLIITTNEERLNLIEANDRRYVVIPTGTQHVQDGEFFIDLRENCLEKGGFEDLLYSLQQTDLSDWNDLVKFSPKTEAYFNNLIETQSPIFKYFYFKIQDGLLKEEYYGDDLIEDIVYETNTTRSFQSLKRLVGENYIPSGSEENLRVRVNGKRERIYKPNIKKLKLRLEEEIGNKIDWNCEEDININIDNEHLKYMVN